MTGFWVGVGSGFLLGCSFVSGLITIRLWWINRDNPPNGRARLG